MKKVFTTILVILIFIIFLASFTIFAIDTIFPNINIPLSDIALVIEIVTSIVILVIIALFLHQEFMKEKKNYKANKIMYSCTAFYFIISNVILFICLFLSVMGAVVGGFWGSRKEVELGIHSRNVISGDLYIGDIVSDTDIEINFAGKVNFDGVQYLEFTNTKVVLLKINGEEVVLDNDSEATPIVYHGICDYELKATLNVDYGTVDGYRGYYLNNPYYDNDAVNIELSPNYMINIDDNLHSYKLLISDAGTPYQYRYSKLEIGIKWIMLFEYVISMPLFAYFGILYSINSIKELKRQ